MNIFYNGEIQSQQNQKEETLNFVALSYNILTSFIPNTKELFFHDNKFILQRSLISYVHRYRCNSQF